MASLGRPLVGLLVAALAGGCSSAPPASGIGAEPKERAALPVAAPPAPSAARELEAENRRCTELRAEAMRAPALPGAPKFEARRVDILGRAKGAPVVWKRAPERAAQAATEPPGLPQLRARLEAGHGSPAAVASVAAQAKWFPQAARTLLLPEGYLYADDPEVASVLVEAVKLDKLFREPEIELSRGSETRRLSLAKDGYRWVDGPDAGTLGSLLLGDRVTVAGQPAGEPLHLDVRALADREGFDRARVERLVEGAVVAELRWGETWVPALLRAEGARLSLSCTVADAAAQAAIDVRRREAALVRPALRRLREVVREEVTEALRFDEPLKEEGQQDGALRAAWQEAYRQGRHTYSFNEVGYAVYDSAGRPHPPQVCIDFILDTFERASGTWYRPRPGPPERAAGRVDFDALGIPNRRSVAGVVKFAAAHPEMFTVQDIPDTDRVPFRDRASFFRYLAAHADDFRPGDVVAIHGLRSDGKLHYHSFLVDDVDPLSGIPILLAANAGSPRVVSWESTMRSAPLRSIRHVVRPRPAWLAAAIGPEAVAAR